MKVGDKVKWQNKIGTIIVIVPTGTQLWDAFKEAYPYPKGQVFNLFSVGDNYHIRKHESYIIAGEPESRGGKRKLYSPNVKSLEVIE
jgi:hypothetical protein